MMRRDLGTLMLATALLFGCATPTESRQETSWLSFVQAASRRATQASLLMEINASCGSTTPTMHLVHDSVSARRSKTFLPMAGCSSLVMEVNTCVSLAGDATKENARTAWPRCGGASAIDGAL